MMFPPLAPTRSALTLSLLAWLLGSVLGSGLTYPAWAEPSSPPDMPDSIDELRALVLELREENRELNAKVVELQAKLTQSLTQTQKAETKNTELQQQADRLAQQTQQLRVVAGVAPVDPKSGAAKPNFSQAINDETGAEYWRSVTLPIEPKAGSRAGHWMGVVHDPVQAEAPPPEAHAVRLIIRTQFSGRLYRDDVRAQVLSAGEPIDLTVVRYDRDARRSTGKVKRDISDETLVLGLTLDQAQAVAQAIQPRLELGRVTLELTAEHLALIRAAAARVAEPG